MKYIIRWNAGYGDSHQVIDVETKQEAIEWAYEEWKEEAEANADYNAEEYTEEKAEGLGLD